MNSAKFTVYLMEILDGKGGRSPVWPQLSSATGWVPFNLTYNLENQQCFFIKKLWSKVEPQIASEVSTNGGVLGWRYVIILIGIGILRELDAYIGDAPRIGW